MKIAIPTKDDIHIANNLEEANGFMVFTIQFGDILEEEFRILHPYDHKGEGKEIPDLIKDCSILFTSESLETRDTMNGATGIEKIRTAETNITKVMINYLNNSLIREANTLCCP
ncbi:MAG: hypothetical protein WCL00_08555 [Bacteroidota bacterium]